MRTTTVAITAPALRLVKTFGERPPAIAAGDYREGMVRMPNDTLRAAYVSMKNKLTALVEPGDVALTKDEMVALYYEVTTKRVDSYNTLGVINKRNFPVIEALVKAGFAYPVENKYYI